MTNALAGNTVENYFNDCRSVLARYLLSQRLEQLASVIAEKRDAARAVIMVYGVYNAGKSTLINALLGEERAAEGPVPTTAVVASYPWQGYELLDTPGVDAPPEHEQITDDQLTKSDVVIFVISSKSMLDEAITYARCIHLLEHGHRVLVVVNNRTGSDWGSLAYHQISDELRRNLNDYLHNTCDARSQEQREALLEQVNTLPIQWVNAKQAKEGRLQDVEVSVRQSGIEALEARLKSLIDETDKGDVQRRLAKYLDGALDDALSEIRAHQEGSVNSEYRRLEEHLMQERNRILAAVARLVRRQQQRLKTEIKLLLESGEQHSQAQIEHAILQLGDELTQELGQTLAAELANASARLDELVTQTASVELALDFELSVDELHAPEPGEREALTVTDRLRQEQYAKILLVLQETKKEHLVSAMQWSKKVLPALFKGVGPKTMEKYADKVLTWVGRGTPLISIGVQAISGAMEYYRATRAIEEERAAKQRYYAQINDLAEDFAFKYEQLARRASEESVRQALQPALDRLQQIEEEQGAQAAQLAAEQRQLHQAKHGLALLSGF